MDRHNYSFQWLQMLAEILGNIMISLNWTNTQVHNLLFFFFNDNQSYLHLNIYLKTHVCIPYFFQWLYQNSSLETKKCIWLDIIKVQNSTLNTIKDSSSAGLTKGIQKHDYLILFFNLVMVCILLGSLEFFLCLITSFFHPRYFFPLFLIWYA